MKRFWDKVEITSLYGCWEWTGGVSGPYGSFWLKGRNHGAHKIAYALTYSVVEGDVKVHHLCENQLCVNPLHLKPMSSKEHSVTHNSKTRCLRGHLRTLENISGTACRKCRAEIRRREHKARPEKTTARNRRYYLNHHENMLKRARRYREDNSEQINARQRKRRAEKKAQRELS